MKLSAFVSSHSSFKNLDGIDFQQRACALAHELNIDATCMDSHVASTDLMQTCLKSIRDSDIVIVLVGWRYGQAYSGDKSLTEIEWQAAESGDKELVVLLHNVPAPPDMQPDERRHAETFRARFDRQGARPLYGQFGDVNSFDVALRRALSAIVSDRSFRVLARNAHEITDILTNGIPTWQLAEVKRVALGGTLTRVTRRSDADRMDIAISAVAGLQSDEDEVSSTTLAAADRCFPGHSRLVVVGEFGSGKTNFLQALRLNAALRLVDNARSSRVPLFVNVGSWNPDVHTFRGFVDAQARATYGARIAGNDLLLLLDEIDNRERPLEADQQAEIVEWLSFHSRAWVAMAVRQLDGLARAVLASKPGLDFSQLALAGLAPLQRSELVLKNAPPGAAQDALLAMIKEAEAGNDDHVLRMFDSPFNLTLLSAFARGASSALPDNVLLVLRARVAAAYERESWAQPAGATRERYLQYMGDLAVRALGVNRKSGVRFDLEESTFYERVAAQTQVFQTSSQRGSRTWTGRYLTYFGAESIVGSDQLADILPAARYGDHGRATGRLDAACHDLIQISPSHFDSLVLYDPCLAAECLQDITPSQRAVPADHCFRTLLLMLRDREESARRSAVEAVVALGDLATPLLSAAMVGPEPHFLRKRLLPALNRIKGADSTMAIVRALTDGNRHIRREAERTVLTFDAERRRHISDFVDALGNGEIAESDRDLLRCLAMVDQSFLPRANALLGEEPIEAPAEVPPPSDVLPEAWVDEDSSGSDELLVQLRNSPGSRDVHQRCLRWLEQSSLRDKGWAHVWTMLYDDASGPEFAFLGRQWLADAAPMAGSWAHVWTRLVKADSGDKTLLKLGRDWLKNASPTHFGWPYVWSVLFDVSSDTTLNDLGLQWLQLPDVSSNWSLVWSRLYERADAQQLSSLKTVGFSRLQQTASDASPWGFVYPKICDEDASEDIRELGRKWVEEAAPGHPSWGYMFPKVLAAFAGDSKVVSIGKDWLVQPNKHVGSWPNVWEALYSRDKADAELLEEGVRLLERLPWNHKGWARVWEEMWTSSFRHERIEEIGLSWLQSDEVGLDHSGWPWTFNAIFKKGHPLGQIGGRALGFLSDPTRHGWATVWRGLWDAANTLGADSSAMREALLPIAPRWLSEDGVKDPGFSYVWEVLWREQPNDALRAQGIARMSASPNDSTIWYIWQPLAKELSSNSAIEAVGLELIRTGMPFKHPHWGAIWLDLWRALKDPALCGRGIVWLADRAGMNNRWVDVWLAIWDETGATVELQEIAIKGLKSKPLNPSFDNYAWSSIWPRLWNAECREQGFLDAAIARLSDSRSHSTESRKTISRDLEAAGLLPDALKHLTELVWPSSECERVARLPFNSKRWIWIWQEAWEHVECRATLAGPGLAWLRLQERGFAHVWQRLYESGIHGEEVLDIGFTWANAGMDQPAWGLVFGGLVRSGRGNEHFLAETQRYWLNKTAYERSSWPSVWLGMWDSDRFDKTSLIAHGEAWLVDGRARKHHVPEIWQRLWDGGGDHARLTDAVQVLLKSRGAVDSLEHIVRFLEHQ